MVVGLLMISGGIAAGLFGSLLGLGGGVLIVPLLTLGFGLPLHQAVGVSLVCVIMTSSAAVGRLPRTARREPAARASPWSCSPRSGRWSAGSIAFLLDERLLEALFAAVLVYVAITMLVGRP